MNQLQKKTIWRTRMIFAAFIQALVKLNPANMIRNPVMFIVEMGAIITTLFTLTDAILGNPYSFNMQLTLWLWITVLFANIGEALAEGRSKAQAQSLKQTRSDIPAKRFRADGTIETVPAITLRQGDYVAIEDGDIIPCDGEIVGGAALIDESAITGESAPVVREWGGDKTGVTGGTKVVSGKIKVKITTSPGQTFLDRMIKMIEHAQRQKTPNERALEILLLGLTILFIIVAFTLKYFAAYVSIPLSIPVLISMVICLVPTTISGLLPAIGIAGMDRLIKHNVIALSGRAVEAAGDVNVVLLDKTGTITYGNRQATEFLPAAGVNAQELARTALLSSLADNTPEGKSIVELAQEKLLHEEIILPPNAVPVNFSAETRMSGIDMPDVKIRKGAGDAIEEFVSALGGSLPQDVSQIVDRIAHEGSTPLVVSSNEKVLGVIRLKDIVKPGIKDRLKLLHKMGIQTVMLTGDNPHTAEAIAAEAGVSSFIAQAKPETKLLSIKAFQEEGHMVAMIGDGTNDAPALAQADVAVAMNAGTQAAREAANMIDLDSSPTKLLDIVAIGKEILITRGSLTTFSIANDVAKYFAIVPALFAARYPMLGILNIMNLSTSNSAMLSAVIFNAAIIPFLIPLALRGVAYKETSPQSLLLKNILKYGMGGLLLPFVGIKLINMVITFFQIA